MKALTGLAVDLHEFAVHHPAQQVDAVDALVHEAAAVLRPRAAPGRLLVVALVAVPAHVDGAVGEPAEAAVLERGARLLDGDVEAVLMAGRNEHAALLGAADDLVRVRHGHGHGLLNDDVHASVDAVESDGGVLAALSCDGDELKLGVLCEHLSVVLVPPDGSIARKVMLGEQLLHLPRKDVAHGDDIETISHCRSDVIRRDAAASDQGILHTKPLTELG